jgi:hypothetical protein
VNFNFTSPENNHPRRLGKKAPSRTAPPEKAMTTGLIIRQTVPMDLLRYRPADISNKTSWKWMVID